jgi:methylthioribose-1-phosphate isomerase
MKTLRAVEFKDDKLFFINQTKLPFTEEIISSDDYERIALAIERLEIRGAPAIGVAAAFALALSIKNISEEKCNTVFEKAYNRLKSTRPTAVNLFYALNEIQSVFEHSKTKNNIYLSLISKAVELQNTDIILCDRIANNGLEIINKKSSVLTHCNTGFLATGGNGTALNVIRNAFEKGMIEHVYVDETRPLFQGSRLTAWELNKLEIPFLIITDSTSGYLMQQNKIDLAIVGADRIASNGDTANKIGTYNVAVLCQYHKIPFYIAAPSTTIDRNCEDGTKIKIENRSPHELTRINESRITLDNYPAFCPAFDVTPNKLITAFITEKEVYKPPYNFKNV